MKARGLRHKHTLHRTASADSSKLIVRLIIALAPLVVERFEVNVVYN